MVVGWVTANVAPSTVQYGTASNSYSQTATGTVDFYKYSALYTSGQIHHATLTGLKPSTVYYYKVAGAAAEYNFTSSPGVGAFYPYKIGFFADIGESLNADDTVLHMLAGSRSIDSYVLNGDIVRLTRARAHAARACCAATATLTNLTPNPRAPRPKPTVLRVGLRVARVRDVGRLPAHDVAARRDQADRDQHRQVRLSPRRARRATHTRPPACARANNPAHPNPHTPLPSHEVADDANGIPAISTRYRFAGMPTGGRADQSYYFSYEAGPAHVISISSFYFGGYGAGSALTKWLVADLASIDRAKTPWVLVSLHAPWYNSNSAHQGDGEGMRAALEAVLVKAGVAAVFSGHVHAYERSYVVNNKQVVADGAGMVHFNIGDAGAGLYTTWSHVAATSAFRSAVFGHGEFELVNATHAHWTWHRNADDEAVVADSVFVVNPTA
jgi:hypothetical protein